MFVPDRFVIEGVENMLNKMALSVAKNKHIDAGGTDAVVWLENRRQMLGKLMSDKLVLVVIMAYTLEKVWYPIKGENAMI